MVTREGDDEEGEEERGRVNGSCREWEGGRRRWRKKHRIRFFLDDKCVVRHCAGKHAESVLKHTAHVLMHGVTT